MLLFWLRYCVLEPGFQAMSHQSLQARGPVLKKHVLLTFFLGLEMQLQFNLVFLLQHKQGLREELCCDEDSDRDRDRATLSDIALN